MIVVVAVTEKQVVINNQFATQPITGRMGIFNRVSAPTEIKPEIEIVGIYTEMATAQQAREQHHATHPQCRYVQKVCGVDALGAPPPPAVCVMCGQDSNGLSFCPACNDQRARALRESDPDLMKEIEAASR